MKQIRIKTIAILEEQIAVSRRKMMDLWDDRGGTDADVLAASIELDQLLNLYHKLTMPPKPR